MKKFNPEKESHYNGKTIDLNMKKLSYAIGRSLIKTLEVVRTSTGIIYRSTKLMADELRDALEPLPVEYRPKTLETVFETFPTDDPFGYEQLAAIKPTKDLSEE